MRGVREFPELARDRYDTCSPMSTALSPTRSRARAAMFMCIPQSSAGRIVRELQRLQVRRPVEAVDRVVHPGESAAQLEVAAGERLHRGADHPAPRSCPSPPAAGAACRWPGSSHGGEVELGHVHRLVADPLEVEAAVQDGGDQPEIGGDRRLERQQPRARLGRYPGRARRSTSSASITARASASSCSTSALDGLVRPRSRRARPGVQRGLESVELLVELPPVSCISRTVRSRSPPFGCPPGS